MRSKIRLLFVAISTIVLVWVNIYYINMPAMACVLLVLLQAFLIPMSAARSLIPILDMKLENRGMVTVLSGMIGGIIPITSYVISTYIAVSNSPQNANHLQYSKQVPLSTSIEIDWMLFGSMWLLMMCFSILGGLAARFWLRKHSDSL